jgi:hypothetical protein
MDKKKIIIGGVALLLIAGIGYYMWNKSKNSATEEGGAEAGSEGATKPADSNTTKSAEAPTDATATAKTPLTTRKEKRKACGRKPLTNKKKRAEWQKCVDAGGTASFEGQYDDYDNFDDFENDYMDFQGSEVDNQFMFSEFENNLDLDL